MTTTSTDQLIAKRAQLAAEIALLDAVISSSSPSFGEDDVETRPFKQAKKTEGIPRTCVACMDVITDGTYLFTCRSNPEQIICASCVPHALQTVAKEDSSLLTAKGLCLSHMSAECSRTTGVGLVDYASCYITTDLRSRLLLKLAEAEHLKCAVVRPLLCMALCPTCGDSASLDVPKTFFCTSPFMMCRKCPRQQPWCLDCRRDVNGTWTDLEKKRYGKNLNFSFVQVRAREKTLALKGPNAHSSCSRIMNFEKVIELVRSSTIKLEHTLPPLLRKDSASTVSFPSEAIQRFFEWALSKQTAMPLFDVHSNTVFPSADKLLSTTRAVANKACGDAFWIRHASFRVLNTLFERGSSQRCLKCGKAGVKDLSCTHMTCCNTTWCYICEGVVRKKKGVPHPCPVTLQCGGWNGTGGMPSATEAIEWFHIAKLSYYARSWMCTVGFARGLATLLDHALWRTFVAEHAEKMFFEAHERDWFFTIRENADVKGECCL